jgi:hypothetical protein
VGVVAVGTEASRATVFFDFEDLLGAVALISLAAGAACAVSAVSDFLLFLDFAAVEVPLAADVVSADSSAFFVFEDFFEADESAVAEVSAVASTFFDFEDFFAAVASDAAGVSVASDFLDLEDFFAVVLSAAAGVSGESDFLLFVGFLVLEESAAAVSSAGGVFFFFFDFAVLVSLWSVVGVVCAAWAADAGRSAKFPSMSRNAKSNETCNRLRVRFIFGEFLSPACDSGSLPGTGISRALGG